MVLAFLGRGVQHEVARNLAAGTNEAHNVGVEGQLALQVYLLLEQLQGLRVQPYMTKALGLERSIVLYLRNILLSLANT